MQRWGGRHQPQNLRAKFLRLITCRTGGTQEVTSRPVDAPRHSVNAPVLLNGAGIAAERLMQRMSNSLNAKHGIDLIDVAIMHKIKHDLLKHVESHLCESHAGLG